MHGFLTIFQECFKTHMAPQKVIFLNNKSAKKIKQTISSHMQNIITLSSYPKIIPILEGILLDLRLLLF